MINQSAAFWREYGARLETVEKLAKSAESAPLRHAALVKLTVRAVRDERRLLRRHLRSRFGISITASFPRHSMRVVDRDRARPGTLSDAVRQYDLLTGYVTLDAALWAIGHATKEASLAKQAEEAARAKGARPYGGARPGYGLETGERLP
jgi:hypothetical protein